MHANISVQNLTATLDDYWPPSTAQVSWAKGDMADKTITVPIKNDALDESDETFRVRLVGLGGNAVLGSPAEAIVTIRDDDPLPAVRFGAASISRLERDGMATIGVGLSAPSSKPVNVMCATSGGTAAAGSDYRAVSTLLTFAPGITYLELEVQIADDAEDEADESFTVSLSGALNATLGAPARHTCTIVNDDPLRVVEFESGSSSGAESTTPAVFAVKLSPASSRPVTVRYATGSEHDSAKSVSDYTARAGTLTSPRGRRRRRSPCRSSTTRRRSPAKFSP